jgi:hypothetical protein
MIVPVVSSAKRLTIYVQNASRSRADRVTYSPCVMLINRPLSLAFSQTTALIPLVLQNESRVRAKRKNARLVSENNIGIIENQLKQFFRIHCGSVRSTLKADS